jgi:hypothetical protein
LNSPLSSKRKGRNVHFGFEDALSHPQVAYTRSASYAVAAALEDGITANPETTTLKL